MFYAQNSTLFGLIFLMMILASICSIAAPGNYSFNYEVQGRQITLKPNIDTTVYTYYKWEIQSNNNQYSDTDWIKINDLYDHVSTVDYDKTYVITLHVKTSTGSIYSTGKTIQISSSSGANDPYYKKTNTDTIKDETGKTYLLGNLVPILLGLHWSLQLLIFVLIIGITIIFIRKKTHIIYFIKKKL